MKLKEIPYSDDDNSLILIMRGESGVVVSIVKENPYHDEQGRFTDEEGDAGGGGGGEGGGFSGGEGGFSLPRIGEGSGGGGSTSHLNRQEARQELIDTFHDIGFKLGQVDTGGLNQDQIDEYIPHIKDLASRYNIQDSKMRLEMIQFKSSGARLGEVRYAKNPSGEAILHSINFGNKYAFGGDDRVLKVDRETERLSTLTHEFGHAVAGHSKGGNSYNKEFWNEANGKWNKYRSEVRNNPKISMGAYSMTSVDEFVAEGFTDYELNKKPSKYGKEVGAMMGKHFKRKKKKIDD